MEGSRFDVQFFVHFWSRFGTSVSVAAASLTVVAVSTWLVATALILGQFDQFLDNSTYGRCTLVIGLP